MSTTVLQDLRAALRLIRSPHRWCRGAFALDARGGDVEVDDPYACRRCAAAALALVTKRTVFDVASTKAYHALEHAVVALFPYDPKTADLDPLEWVNDHFTHVDVVRVFKRAIRDQRSLAR